MRKILTFFSSRQYEYDRDYRNVFCWPKIDSCYSFIFKYLLYVNVFRQTKYMKRHKNKIRVVIINSSGVLFHCTMHSKGLVVKNRIESVSAFCVLQKLGGNIYLSRTMSAYWKKKGKLLQCQCQYKYERQKNDPLISAHWEKTVVSKKE